MKRNKRKFEIYKGYKIYNPEDKIHFILFDKTGKKIIEDNNKRKLINICQVYSFINLKEYEEIKKESFSEIKINIEKD